MSVREPFLGPVARVGLWLPVATLVGFALLAAAGLVAFPDAVMAVTVLAAVGWVAVGFGGDHLRGPLEGDRDVLAGGGADSAAGHGSGGVDATTGVLTYLTVTAGLGWVVLLLFVGL